MHLQALLVRSCSLQTQHIIFFAIILITIVIMLTITVVHDDAVVMIGFAASCVDVAEREAVAVRSRRGDSTGALTAFRSQATAG